MPAGELRVGDRVAEDRDGRVALLASIVRLGQSNPVFNLTVSGTHTYFVRAGLNDLWVHNADPCNPHNHHIVPQDVAKELPFKDPATGETVPLRG